MMMMMSKFTENLKQWRKRNSDNFEEEYKISYNCCLFHDISELINFTNIDDDRLKEY